MPTVAAQLTLTEAPFQQRLDQLRSDSRRTGSKGADVGRSLGDSPGLALGISCPVYEPEVSNRLKVPRSEEGSPAVRGPALAQNQTVDLSESSPKLSDPLQTEPTRIGSGSGLLRAVGFLAVGQEANSPALVDSPGQKVRDSWQHEEVKGVLGGDEGQQWMQRGLGKEECLAVGQRRFISVRDFECTVEEKVVNAGSELTLVTVYTNPLGAADDLKE